MATSQNGYRANDRSLIASYTVPGTTQRLALRKGDVSVVLLYVADQYNRRVEKLRTGWNWGYAERPIRGSSTTLSNHASGTAIDLMAPDHPLGKRGTFTAAEVREIREILDELDGVVRWGGDYRNRADEMHFEIVGSAAQVHAVANKIRKGRISSGSALRGRKVYNVPPTQRFGKVKRGAKAQFRNEPWGKVEAVKTSGSWEFDKKVRIRGVLWVRVATGDHRWVPARSFNFSHRKV